MSTIPIILLRISKNSFNFFLKRIAQTIIVINVHNHNGLIPINYNILYIIIRVGNCNIYYLLNE